MSENNFVFSRGSVTVGELVLGNVPKLVIDGKVVHFSTDNMSEDNLQLFKAVMNAPETGMAVDFSYKSKAPHGRGVSFKAKGKLFNGPLFFQKDKWQTLKFALSIDEINFTLEPEKETGKENP